MGIVTQTVGQQKYIGMQKDLEYKIDLIKEAKLNLTMSMTELVNVGTDLDPSNPMVKQLQARKEKLHQLEKKLDMQLQMYETQLQIVQQNMSSLIRFMFKADLLLFLIIILDKNMLTFEACALLRLKFF